MRLAHGVTTKLILLLFYSRTDIYLLVVGQQRLGSRDISPQYTMRPLLFDRSTQLQALRYDGEQFSNRPSTSFRATISVA